MGNKAEHKQAKKIWTVFTYFAIVKYKFETKYTKEK
jgi:hypothetical protein